MELIYSINKKKDSLNLGVINPETDKLLWQVNYPSFSENKATGEMEEDTTLIGFGIMKDANDVTGLCDFLKSQGIINDEDTLTLKESKDNKILFPLYVAYKGSVWKYDWSAYFGSGYIKLTDKMKKNPKHTFISQRQMLNHLKRDFAVVAVDPKPGDQIINDIKYSEWLKK